MNLEQIAERHPDTKLSSWQKEVSEAEVQTKREDTGKASHKQGIEPRKKVKILIQKLFLFRIHEFGTVQPAKTMALPNLLITLQHSEAQRKKRAAICSGRPIWEQS